MNPQDWTPDQTPISLYNPLNHDITIERFNDENTIEKYTIPTMSAITFPAYIANFLKRHLVDEIINERRIGIVTPEKRREIEEEVLV